MHLLRISDTILDLFTSGNVTTFFYVGISWIALIAELIFLVIIGLLSVGKIIFSKILYFYLAQHSDLLVFILCDLSDYYILAMKRSVSAGINFWDFVTLPIFISFVVFILACCTWYLTGMFYHACQRWAWVHKCHAVKILGVVDVEIMLLLCPVFESRGNPGVTRESRVTPALRENSVFELSNPGVNSG